MEIYERCKELGVDSLDAPVSGGDFCAQNGILTVMCRGNKPTFEKASEIMSVYGKNVKLLGGLGCGQHKKCSNQIVGSMIGVVESLIYGQKAG